MFERGGFWILLVAAAALAAGFYIGTSRLDPPASEADALLAGTIFTTLRNEPVRLNRWADRPQIVNFWATWCAPCRQEMPLLNRFQFEHVGEVQVIAIAVGDDPAKVAKFVDSAGIRLPILLGNADSLNLMKELGNKTGGLPFTVFLDKDAKIQGQHLGPLTEKSLADALKSVQDR